MREEKRERGRDRVRGEISDAEMKRRDDKIRCLLGNMTVVNKQS